jgi:hypothetical protein
MSSKHKLDVKALHLNNRSLVIGQPWQGWCVLKGWKSGSTIIAWIKMEDACILYNVTEIFWQRKVTNIESEGPFVFLKVQMSLTQLCKNTSAYLYKHSNISIARGRNWSMGGQ